MKRFPWKRVSVLVLAACLLATTWPYWLAAGTAGWMKARGKSLHCDMRGTLLSAKTALNELEEAKRIQAAMRRLNRDAQGLELWSTPDGPVWTPPGGGEAIAQDMAEQHRGIYAQFGSGVRPGDVVIDAGANVGLFTRTALRAGASKVIAIEPVPAVIECLKRNLKDDIAAGRVIVVEKGAWDKDDFLEMNVYPDNMAANSFVGHRNEKEEKLRLPLTTLDKIVAELQVSRVDFIKMDIEGSERHAVRGAATIIRRDRPRLALCVYHLADDPVAIPREVTTLRSDYRQTCGACVAEKDAITPQVFFFN